MHGTQDSPSPASGTPQRLVSVDAAAKSLSITRRELYRRIGLGELPSVRIGRRRLIEVAELDAYVARLREAVA